MSTTWNLESHRATLLANGLTTELDLVRPGLGLHNVRVGAAPLLESHLLGVQWGDDGVRAPSDSYLRGNDLIVTYAEDSQHPYAPQIYWRCVSAIPPGPQAGTAQLELLVSVQTQWLDVQPAMTTTTRLPAVDIHHLTDVERGRWTEVATGGADVTIEPRDGSGCLLMRLANCVWTYVEMVHPLDFVQGRLTLSATAGGALVSHALIDCRLEKGVIIRARVRGCFLPRQDDMAAALRLYEEFAGSAWPLSA